MRKSSSGPVNLHYADSVRNGDMLYLGGVQVPDPFLAAVFEGSRLAVVSKLEFNRVSRTSRFDETLSMEAVLERGLKIWPKAKKGPALVAATIAKERDWKEFLVDSAFPIGLARELEQFGFEVGVEFGMLFPEREFKTDEEAEFIREGNQAASAGFKIVEKTLRAAKVGKGGYLMEGRRRLTSERLQELIAIACLEKGAIASDTIVAGGDHACDPHERGHGPLRANELIIVDIFPRVAKTGYHGDMTRTYLKGRASEEQRHLMETVKDAHGWAIAEHRARKSAPKIYSKVLEMFESAGYPTTYENGVPVGFFHGLGHGLGLAVHESPRVSPAGSQLRSGQVITVEPGLYYPGLGGARIEDVIRVTSGEPEWLSSHSYRWEIR